MSRIQVYVLTGFLGAGKTSLLNGILRDGALARTGVVVNEFGEIGLDSLFLGVAGDQLIEMAGGCLCCTAGGELASTLMQLAGRELDRVVIETSGLADPGPVLDSLLQDPILRERFEPGGVVTMVDALNAEATLGDHEEARSQVSLADLLIVAKADLLEPGARVGALTRLDEILRVLNPLAPVVVRTDAASMAGLLTQRLWMQGAESNSPASADPASANRGHHGNHDHDHHHDHAHDHARGAGIASVSIRHDTPLPRAAVEAFGQLLASAHGRHVLRLKGIVATAESDLPLAIHGVRNRFHEPQVLDAWPDSDRSTRIVAILRDMDPSFVEKLFAGFANLALPDTPDRQALTDNPLAIPSVTRWR